MIFYRDLDMIEEEEKLYNSEKFKSLYPDYDPSKKDKDVDEKDITDYRSLTLELGYPLNDDEYIRNKIKPDFWIRGNLFLLQKKQIKKVYQCLLEFTDEELYSYCSNYDFIDLTRTEAINDYFEEEQYPAFFRSLSDPRRLIMNKLNEPNLIHGYVNEILGYRNLVKDYPYLTEDRIIEAIIEADEHFQSILRHNSKDGSPLSWPLFNTAEGQLYIASELKEIRKPLIISKAKEYHNKPDNEIEPVKYELHFLKFEPVFKELAEDKNYNPNYVKLLSERIDKYEADYKEEDYKINRIFPILYKQKG